MTSCLRRPVLSLPKQIPIQSLLYKMTTCLTWPVTTFFVSQMKKKLFKGSFILIFFKCHKQKWCMLLCTCAGVCLWFHASNGENWYTRVIYCIRLRYRYQVYGGLWVFKYMCWFFYYLWETKLRSKKIKFWNFETSHHLSTSTSIRFAIKITNFDSKEWSAV